MVWFKGYTLNEIRGTDADDYFAMFIREETRRKKEADKIEEERNKGSRYQGQRNNEYIPEDPPMEDSQEMVDFFMEDEEYTGE